MPAHIDTAEFRDRRLLVTLERLLGLRNVDLGLALGQATQLVAEALDADKADCFLYDPAKHTLVVLGTSPTRMAQWQIAVGLDRLPLANGGRAVQVFRSATPFLTGHADRDPEELEEVILLGIKSTMLCPLDVAGDCRGVLQASSKRPEAYSGEDLRFLQAVAHWVGMVLHLADLVERGSDLTAEQTREAANEELISLLTPRQREIAALIAAGLTNEEIAEKLVLAKGSVANHVDRILNRLGAKRRAQIAAWIVEQRLHRAQPNPDA